MENSDFQRIRRTVKKSEQDKGAPPQGPHRRYLPAPNYWYRAKLLKALKPGKIVQATLYKMTATLDPDADDSSDFVGEWGDAPVTPEQKINVICSQLGGAETLPKDSMVTVLWMADNCWDVVTGPCPS